MDKIIAGKFGGLLRDHPGATFGFVEADALIPRDRFVVGVPCAFRPLPCRAGYGGEKAWGTADTLDGALCIALARRDALDRVEAA